MHFYSTHCYSMHSINNYSKSPSIRVTSDLDFFKYIALTNKSLKFDSELQQDSNLKMIAKLKINYLFDTVAHSPLSFPMDTHKNILERNYPSEVQGDTCIHNHHPMIHCTNSYLQNKVSQCNLSGIIIYCNE